MIETSMKADTIIVSSLKTSNLDGSTLILEHIPNIYYLLYFKKDQAKVQTLINFSNKINAMTPANTKKLGFWIQKTDVRAHKIDRYSLAI